MERLRFGLRVQSSASTVLVAYGNMTVSDAGRPNDFTIKELRRHASTVHEMRNMNRASFPEMPFPSPPLPTVAIIRTAISPPDPLGFSLHPPSSYSPPLLPFNCFLTPLRNFAFLLIYPTCIRVFFYFILIALLWLLISVETEVDDSYRSLVDYGIFVETEVDGPAPVPADSIVCGALHSKSYLELPLIPVQRPF